MRERSEQTGQTEPATQALQGALATEHAAVWAYGLARAFLDPPSEPAATEGLAAHQARRDGAERMLADAGLPVPAAAPGYLPPRPVTDPPSAIELLIASEDDTAAAWRYVVEQGTLGLRIAAVEALTAAAIRAARWRAAAGTTPATVPFPGLAT